MERHVSGAIAAKFTDAIRIIDEALDYMKENVEAKERAPLIKAIGRIFSIVSDEVYYPLAKENDELRELLFPDLSAEEFLRMYQTRNPLP